MMVGGGQWVSCQQAAQVIWARVAGPLDFSTEARSLFI